MCGFLGTVHNNNFFIGKEEFNKNLNLINYRGPDDTGIHFFQDLRFFFKFGHKRLSIIDLSKKGHQPMISKNNSTLIFNGEIYNHIVIRKIIEEKYYINWKSNSDTETLIHFLEFFDIDYVLDKIQGMFAFVFYNKIKNEIILSRDLAGEKPLYIQTDNDHISFSSDIKPLSNNPKFEKKINPEALKKYLKYTYVPYPISIYENIFKLPPASYIKIDLKNFQTNKCETFNDLITKTGVEFKEWWKINNIIENKISFNNRNVLTNVENLLTSAVEKQLISDAPLGAFLSGGIDSSLIVSIASKLKRNINTFTVGYDYEKYDESKHAELISSHLGTNHNSYICRKNDALNLIPNLYDAYSEPFADSSQIPTLLISKAANKSVKVALSGDGGDELFGGYNRYLFAYKYWKYINLLPVNIRNFFINLFMLTPDIFQSYFLELFFFNKISGSSSKSTKFLEKIKKIENKYSFYDSLVSNWENDSNITNNFNQFLNNNYINFFNNFPYKKLEDLMMISDFKSYLTDGIMCKVDRASMYNSLETRSPFLDKNVVNFAFSLPTDYKINNNNTKWILKEILSKYIPKKLFMRPKMGFGIPISKWLKNDLKDYMFDNLSINENKKHNLFNIDLINKTINDHLENKYNNEHKIWSLIQFNIWYSNNF